jgi:hypothetical protein
MKDISEHLTYNQVVYSEIAIRYSLNNIPTEDSIKYIRDLAEYVYEPIYKQFKGKIRVTSCYRCSKVNKLINGSKSSQHQALKGAAIDISSTDSKVTNKQLFDWVLSHLDIDQLIWEYGNTEEPAWVHISFHKDHNRNQVIYKI